jgi:hypothetical protein
VARRRSQDSARHESERLSTGNQPSAAELSRLDRRIRRTVASETPTVFAIARPDRPLEAISSSAWAFDRGPPRPRRAVGAESWVLNIVPADVHRDPQAAALGEIQ